MKKLNISFQCKESKATKSLKFRKTCSPKQTFKYRPKVYLVAWQALAPQRSNHL